MPITTTPSSSSSSCHPQCLDLPDPITELILERLPLIDYIRFGSVCQKWQSIQRGHRLRHSPFPPPMPHPRPWLIPYQLSCHDPTIKCHSPLERRSYRLPFPSSGGRLHGARCLASCRGWLLLLRDDSLRPVLLNPVTRVQFLLPPLVPPAGCSYLGAMSAPPTDPDCVLLLIDAAAVVFLHRLSDHGADWMAIRTAIRELVTSVVYCGGKFYVKYHWGKLCVVDPLLPTPEIRFLDMDYGLIFSELSSSDTLAESEGEVFLVETLYDSGCEDSVINGVRVWRADLSGMKWERVETLGDRVVFADDICSMSLVAADVGCKRNRIYRSEIVEFGMDLWSIFDLRTGVLMEEAPVSMKAGAWFLPTLDYANPGQANIDSIQCSNHGSRAMSSDL